MPWATQVSLCHVARWFGAHVHASFPTGSPDHWPPAHVAPLCCDVLCSAALLDRSSQSKSDSPSMMSRGFVQDQSIRGLDSVETFSLPQNSPHPPNPLIPSPKPPSPSPPTPDPCPCHSFSCRRPGAWNCGPADV